MSRRTPVQKRSRDRMEQILLAAAEQLAKTGNSDDLTTTSVSKRSGVPVATIYRYFTDRIAIIATLIDRETEAIDEEIVKRLNALETVSVESLLDTLMMAHLEHFQASRRSIVLWFGARKSPKVLARVDRRYEYLADWVFQGCINAGLAKPDAPAYGGEFIVWLSDRVFEVIFRKDRPVAEQAEIMREFIDMMTTRVMLYSIPGAPTEVSLEFFIEKAGPWEPDTLAIEETDD